MVTKYKYRALLEFYGPKLHQSTAQEQTPEQYFETVPKFISWVKTDVKNIS